MHRFSTVFDKENLERLSGSQNQNVSDFAARKKNIDDLSPILREQRRRSSSGSTQFGSIDVFKSQRSDIFASGVFVPNSVVRRKSIVAKESESQEGEKRRLSNKELEEKILKRLTKENVEVDLNAKKTSEYFRLLTPELPNEEEGSKKKKKKGVDKDKEMQRILRRTSLITPYHEGRMSTSESIKEAIKKSEKKHDLLVQPEELIHQHKHNDAEKPPVQLTSSWIKRVSESLSSSAKRVSELTQQMTVNKHTPVSTEKPKENDKGSPIQVHSSPTSPTQKKKEKPAIKKKSSLKLSKLGSSSYMHPTIHEVEEEPFARRSESRQTQLSGTSSTRGASARSLVSLQRRSSSATGSVRRVSSGNAKKDFGKQLSSASKEKTSKASVTSKNSLLGKEVEDTPSRRSSMSQRSSFSDKHPGSSSSRTRRASLKSISSKQKIEGQGSRTSTRARSVSSDDTDITVSTVEEVRDRMSLSSLIELYYDSPNRRSTSESLQKYMAKLFHKKEETHRMKHKKQENKSETSIRFSDVEVHPSDSDESSFIIKRGEESTDDEASQLDKSEDATMIEGESMKNIIASETKKVVDQTFSENFQNLMNEVTDKLKSFEHRHDHSHRYESLTGREVKKPKKNSISEKKLSDEYKPGVKRKKRNSEQTKRNSKNNADRKEINERITEPSRSSLTVKSILNKTKVKQTSSPPVLVKRKTLDSDAETLKYLISKKIISLSTSTETKVKDKKLKEGNTNVIPDMNTSPIEAV